MKRLALPILIIIQTLFTTACHVGGSITDLDKASQKEVQKRKSPDLVLGETIKTTSGTPGYLIRGSVGEISEVKTTSSNYRIEGVFYE